MRALAEALEQLDRPVEVFFRDDDAGWSDPELLALVALFEGRDLPIDLAVIPVALQPSTARELRACRDRFTLLGLHQHGYAHVNHEPPAARKCEFGSARPLDRQLADVIAGRERLQDLLGATDPIFTPPWNRALGGLLGALAGSGFAMVSTDGMRNDLTAPIGQLPVSLDRERARRELRLEAALARQVAQSAGPVGIMLHHAEMNEVARRELGAVLDLMHDCPALTVRPMRHWMGTVIP